jgi:hypothetical protein
MGGSKKKDVREDNILITIGRSGITSLDSQAASWPRKNIKSCGMTRTEYA